VTTVLLYAILLLNAVAALRYPWVGMVLAYLMAVLAPHDIWWWAFQDVRPFYTVVAPALIGFLAAALTGKVDFSVLGTRINRCMVVLWICFTISYFFGPYVNVINEYRFYDPALMHATLQKTYLTYFVTVLLIDRRERLGVACLVIIATVVYLTYWGNAQYFIYHKFGRLHGPTTPDGQGIYADENNFAVLFVIGFPFLFYFGQHLKNVFLKWAVWAVIPFSWHVVFLTASRGALVGIAAVLLLFAMRLKRKSVALIVLAAFVGAFVWQAGDVMKSRSATITEYEQEDSAEARLQAWAAAIGMMEAHPLTGVGFASFGQAFPDFSDKRPRVAHNTFFQIGGEWGIAAGVTYLVLVLSALNALRKNGTRLRLLSDSEETRLYYHVNEACLLGLGGFFVCSMFLSLQGYEVLYYLLVLSNGVLWASGYFGAKKATGVLERARPAVRRGRIRIGPAGVRGADRQIPLKRREV
jgi:probable O-glycosylation ligase (exosortase A-associated)